VVAVTGSGGKSTIIERLREETGAGLRLIEIHGEPTPAEASVVIVVAGLDALGDPAASSKAAEALAAELANPAGRPQDTRVVYVLNKSDDELRLQQAKQVSALLRGTTVITADGYVVWPNEQAGPS
jgi:hypothetical protein